MGAGSSLSSNTTTCLQSLPGAVAGSSLSSLTLGRLQSLPAADSQNPSGSSRGSASLAKEVASDPALLAAARERLCGRWYAPGTVQVKNSKLELVEAVALRAGHTTIYPLTESIVIDISAALLAGGYSSGASYLAELRLAHIERDFAVGPALGRRFQKCSDALNRGQGPPKRAVEVKPDELEFNIYSADNGPLVGSTRSFVTAAAWLLREAELSDLDASSRNISLHGDGSVTLHIPMSKMDQRGCGASRRLACICSINPYDSASPCKACGACAVREQLRVLKSTFGASLDDPIDTASPLFPDLTGRRPLKSLVIDAWRHASGNPEVSGHTPRRSGAKTKTRVGWVVVMTQFFGRWGGPTVLSYIEEALSEQTHLWPQASSSQRAPAGVLEQLAPLASHSLPDQVLASLTDRMSNADLAIDRLRADLDTSLSAAADASLDSPALAAPSATPLQAIYDGGKAHILIDGIIAFPRPMWASLCGWKCGAAVTARIVPLNSVPSLGYSFCAKCAKRVPESLPSCAPEAVG